MGRLAARRIDDDQLARLAALIESPPPMTPTVTPFELTEWDMAFHRGIADASGNRYLQAALQRIQATAQRLLVFAYRVGPFVPPTVDEHREILTALRAHDAEVVAERLNRHIRLAKDRILKVI